MSAVPKRLLNLITRSLGVWGTLLLILDFCMVGADSSLSVIDQVIQFTALFVIWFPYFQYNRLIEPLVFRAQLIQLADGPAQVKVLVRQVDLSKVFFSIFCTIRLRKALVFE